MVKPCYSAPKRYSRWWRGLLGALLTLLVLVPYMMGGDSEKYLRRWLSSFNQENAAFHLELHNYQRHWFTSDSNILMTNPTWPTPLHFHLKIYHGPLFFNAGHGLRFGLAFIKSNIDVSAFVNQENTIKLAGSVQLNAFIPYFNDRELQFSVAKISFHDQQNKFITILQNLKGTIDNEGLVQLQIPDLTINHLDGSLAAHFNTSFLQILPQAQLISIAIKEIAIQQKNTINLDNFILQAIATNSNNDTTLIDLDGHFDQIKQVSANTTLETGPFQFKLTINNLQTTKLLAFLSKLKTLLFEQKDLTALQQKILKKAWFNIFSENSTYELTTELSTPNGPCKTSFHGGFHLNTQTPQTTNKLLDAFYGKGQIQLSKDLHDTLYDYINQDHNKKLEDINTNNIALSVILNAFYQEDDQYKLQIDIHQGRITFNRKKFS